MLLGLPWGVGPAAPPPPPNYAGLRAAAPPCRARHPSLLHPPPRPPPLCCDRPVARGERTRAAAPPSASPPRRSSAAIPPPPPMAPALASFLTRAGPSTWLTAGDLPAALSPGAPAEATLAAAAATAAAAGCGVTVTPAPGGRGVAFAFAQVPSAKDGSEGGGRRRRGVAGRLLSLGILSYRLAMGAGLTVAVGVPTAVAAVFTAFGGWGGGWWLHSVLGSTAPLLAMGIDTASPGGGDGGADAPLPLLPTLLAITAGDCRRERLEVVADGVRWARLRAAIAAADGVIPAAVAAAHLGDLTASPDAAAALAAGVLGGTPVVVPPPAGSRGGSPAAARGTVVWAFPGLTPATAASPAARSQLRALARSAPSPVAGGATSTTTIAGVAGGVGYVPPAPRWLPGTVTAAAGLVWVVVAMGQLAAVVAIAAHLRFTYRGGGSAVTRAARAAFPAARAYAFAFVAGGLARAAALRGRRAEWTTAAARSAAGVDAAAAAAAAATAEMVRRRRSWDGVLGVPGGPSGGEVASGGDGQGLYPQI